MSKHTSISSVALVDSQWQLPGLGTPPESSASKTNTAPKSSTDTGPPSQSSKTSESLTAQSGAEPDCSQADFLVNLSVKPGSSEARKMTVTSGLKCSELLKKQDPISCLQRMLLASSTWHSTMCFLNWKAKGTPQGRLLFQLVPSTPRTDETECGLLPTPSASDGPKWYRVKRESAQRRVTDGRQEMLIHAAARLKHYPQWSVYIANPRFWEPMMGYPSGWTDLKPSETPSSRK